MTLAAPTPGPRWLGDAGQVAAAGVMALVLLPVGWTAVTDGGIARTWQWALLAALVVLHGSVGTARRCPLPSYAVGAAAMLVLLAGPDLGGRTAAAAGSDYGPALLPSSLCFFVLLYAVSARTPRPWPTAALAVGLLGCLLTVVRLHGFGGAELEGWTWWLMLTTATVGGTVAAWALGRFRATREEWVAQLAEHGAAEERRRIAREMHDVVAHSLAVVVSHAEAGRLVVAQSPDRATEILGTIAGTGREALTEMRALLGVLGDGAASSAPQPGLGDLADLVDGMRAAGLTVEYDAAPLPSVPPAVALTAFRVVQEALTNVTRHAPRGTAATVSVRRDEDGLHVLVADDGGSAAAVAPGRGLTGMRERVEAVGGALEAGPAEHGWRVSARMPL